MDFISIDTVKKLYKILTSIWDKRDKELEEIADNFGDPRLLAKYYIQPNCQQHNPTDFDEDSIRSSVKAEIFNTINDFLARETIERDGRNQLFVLADAGMGKTSLFLMLKISQLFSFWPTGFNCVLLKLGENTLEELKAQTNKSKTVLLMDALDEDPEARGRISARLQELLTASSGFRHVLISCRTQFFPDTGVDAFARPGQVHVAARTCPMIFMSLFDNNQVSAYLGKRFPAPWHNFLTKRVNQRRIKAETLLHSMQSLQFRPLLLAHIEDLLDSEQTHWNNYTVYEALIKHWLQREIRRMQENEIPRIPNEQELWAACRLIAIYLQSHDKRLLSEQELEQLITRLPIVSYLSHFDFGGRSLLNRTSSKEYRFAHYSIQEFFLAHAACTVTLNADRELFPELELPRLTAQVINFMQCIDQKWVLKTLSNYNWQELAVKISTELFNLINSNALTASERAEAERIFTIMGDKRPGVGLKNGLPDIKWQKIPKGKISIVGKDFESEEFYLAKYPVTNAQFQSFIDDNGYNITAPWWNDLAEKFSAPAISRGTEANHPRETVSWYEAMAFCAWASERLGYTITLPTEWQWQQAACSGNADFDYPWGKSYQTGYANINETVGNAGTRNLQTTSAVGLYSPQGDSLQSVSDLSGNVWEWCLNEYENPANSQVSGTLGRVVRGGSWIYNQDYARASYRNDDDPDDRDDNIGFRVCCLSPIMSTGHGDTDL